MGGQKLKRSHSVQSQTSSHLTAELSDARDLQWCLPSEECLGPAPRPKDELNSAGGQVVSVSLGTPLLCGARPAEKQRGRSCLGRD